MSQHPNFHQAFLSPHLFRSALLFAFPQSPYVQKVWIFTVQICRNFIPSESVYKKPSTKAFLQSHVDEAHCCDTSRSLEFSLDGTVKRHLAQ